MNTKLCPWRKALALGLLLSGVALVAAAPAAHADTVDKNTIGTWAFPLNGGRWLWQINADGTYEFHSEAPDGAAPHAGTISAAGGIWSLAATNGYADGGTYSFQPPDTLVASGHLGTASWRRIANDANDPNLIGTWALALKGGRWVWKINADGTYAFHSEAGDGVAPHAGKVAISDGYWWLAATNGYADGGVYTFQPPDSLSATGHLGTAAWQSSAAWSKLTAQSAVDGDSGALQALTTAAQQGDPLAQEWLAVYFHSTNDDVQSVAWYRKAAAQGDGAAEYGLGLDYNDGTGVAQDSAQAVAWWTKAAAQGNTDAEFNLGVNYHDGRGVAKDDVQSIAWYRKAAEQGDADAEYNLGVDYDGGIGVAKDEGQAITWWQKAAAQGQSNAEFNLGNAYHEGNGVPKDDAQAVAWWQKAAAQGNAKAKIGLELEGLSGGSN